MQQSNEELSAICEQRLKLLKAYVDVLTIPDVSDKDMGRFIDSVNAEVTLLIRIGLKINSQNTNNND